VLPVVEEFLREMAPYESRERAQRYRHLRQSLRDPNFQNQVDHDESLNFLVRDTISLTMLAGSEQTNVIPAEAWANLDVRLLPGEDPQRFLDTIRKLVDDPEITVEPVSGPFRQANYSPTDTKLYAAIRQVAAHYFPTVPVVPRLTSGYTENQRYRPLGINAYGFSPYSASNAEGSTEHGNDERIRVEEVRRGPAILYDVVMAVAGAT
jgi:acetylornithine deacetylase/succinyl-diaminopimelate desuccinylase-like protein